MKTCLIADDSQIVRRVARKLLEGFGLKVLESVTSEETLNVIQEKNPDVVLLDWYMPERTGLDMMTVLGQIPKAKRPVVIFCTTENHVENIEKALAAGADEYIMKPFDEEILRTKLVQTGILEA